MFSSRTPTNLTPNRLTQALGRARAAGQAILDLSESNPTRAGFEYPADLLAPLADPCGLAYAPQPLGIMDARRAAAGEYARRGLNVPPEHIVLTASTSDAYALLFKVLTDGGDEVLIPRPSYPLFDHLTRLDLVVPRPYDLEYHGRWSIDFESVERAWTARTRAVLIVSPNNPTGSFVSAPDLDRLAAICADRGAAIIADEVFVDYPIDSAAASAAGCATERRDALTFSLGGLSKSIGLPQVKLGWMAVAGPGDLVASALERLELACDTYLSVATPVQIAAARLLARGTAIREQITSRISANYQVLCDEVQKVPACRVLAAEGGWYAVLRVPTLQPEEDLVVDLLVHDSVLTHPGYFFDFPMESHLVVGLLSPQPTFLQGIRRIMHRVSGNDA